MKRIWYYDTAAGRLGFAERGGQLTDLFFETSRPPEGMKEETPLLKEAKKQVDEYLAGTRKEFDLPLLMEGTPFQQRVWAALQTIPYGETRSYHEIAVLTGNEKAVRAVGSANGRNPIAIIVPCHRVINTGGKLGGYGGGLPLKRQLLELEGAL